jgi:hypothetical protein
MKKLVSFKSFLVIFILFFAFTSQAQKPENWTSKQLMEPSELANAITTQKELPFIISVGPGATIPHSFDAGMANNNDGIVKLKAQLKGMDKNKKVVIYCGCCPFEHCPNVRPAIDALKEMKFTSYYLLNLPHNIKKDWIDQGYPVSKL